MRELLSENIGMAVPICLSQLHEPVCAKRNSGNLALKLPWREKNVTRPEGWETHRIVLPAVQTLNARWALLSDEAEQAGYLCENEFTKGERRLPNPRYD